jgi:hypothetical protein
MMKLLRRIDHFMRLPWILERLNDAILVVAGFLVGYFCGLGLL